MLSIIPSTMHLHVTCRELYVTNVEKTVPSTSVSNVVFRRCYPSFHCCLMLILASQINHHPIRGIYIVIAIFIAVVCSEIDNLLC